MAQASSVISPGYTLIGSTPAPGSAPVSYQIQTPEGTINAGDTFFTLVNPNDRTTILKFSSGAEVVLSNQQLDTFRVGLNNAWDAVNRSLRSQTTTVPATRPTNVTNVTNNTTSTASAAVITTPTTVTVITEERTTTTSSGSRTITVPPTVPAATTAPDTTGDTISFPPPIDSSLEGSPEFEEQSANLLTEPQTIEDPDDLFSEEDDSFFTEDEDFADIDEEIDDTGDGEEGEEIVVTGRIDWRVKLSLAEGSEYLYNSPDAGVLEPLFDQNGVVFPYTPAINVNYVANYEPASIVHNNYKVYQYSNSAVDAVTITCEFTAQDTKEARYLLAVIHFFRSMTKMFYGQDQQPRAGTPPPLCYLRGMGTFQFKNHPLAITSFSYNLPNDVDYISTTGASTTGSLISRNNQSSSLRLPPNILPGGVAPPPTFTQGLTEGIYDFTLTWVPTKIQMAITCVPMMSRNDVSNEFSLEGYANGGIYSDRGFW